MSGEMFDVDATVIDVSSDGVRERQSSTIFVDPEISWICRYNLLVDEFVETLDSCWFCSGFVETDWVVVCENNCK